MSNKGAAPTTGEAGREEHEGEEKQDSSLEGSGRATRVLLLQRGRPGYEEMQDSRLEVACCTDFVQARFYQSINLPKT